MGIGVTYGLASVVVGSWLNKWPGEMEDARHPPPGEIVLALCESDPLIDPEQILMHH